MTKKRTYRRKKAYPKKRYNKKRYSRRTNGYIPKQLIRYVNRAVSNKSDNSSICTWRDVDSGQISCEANQVSYTPIDFLTAAQIENAIDQAKILDPAGGTLAEVTVDLTTIDGLKTKILNAKLVRTLRNNGQTPCTIKCYYVFSKMRVAQSMSIAFEDGLENSGIIANELTDCRFDVYDSHTFKQFFDIKRVKTFRLGAGDEVTLQLNRRRPFLYDPDLLDQHSASQKVPKVYQGIFIRMEGVVSHDDTDTSAVGTCNATLDWVEHCHIKYSVNSGMKLKNLLVGSGAFDAQVTPKVNIDQVIEVSETL